MLLTIQTCNIDTVTSTQLETHVRELEWTHVAVNAVHFMLEQVFQLLQGKLHVLFCHHQNQEIKKSLLLYLHFAYVPH